MCRKHYNTLKELQISLRIAWVTIAGTENLLTKLPIEREVTS